MFHHTAELELRTIALLEAFVVYGFNSSSHSHQSGLTCFFFATSACDSRRSLALPSPLSISPFARVFGLDELLEVGDDELDVLGGGGDLTVAEDLLNVGEIGASFNKVGGAGMPQSVRMKPGDTGGYAVVPYDAAEGDPSEPSADTVQEQGVLFRVVEQDEASALEIAVERLKCLSGNGQYAILSSLSRTNDKGSLLKVDVIDVELLAFADSDGGSVEGLEDGAVSHADSRMPGRHVQELLDLFFGRNEPRKALGTRNTQVRGGVMEKNASPVEIGEEPLHRGEIGAPGARSKRPSVSALSPLERNHEGNEGFLVNAPDVVDAVLTQVMKEKLEHALGELEIAFREAAELELVQVLAQELLELIRAGGHER